MKLAKSSADMKLFYKAFSMTPEVIFCVFICNVELNPSHSYTANKTFARYTLYFHLYEINELIKIVA